MGVSGILIFLVVQYLVRYCIYVHFLCVQCQNYFNSYLFQNKALPPPPLHQIWYASFIPLSFNQMIFRDIFISVCSYYCASKKIVTHFFLQTFYFLFFKALLDAILLYCSRTFLFAQHHLSILSNWGRARFQCVMPCCSIIKLVQSLERLNQADKLQWIQWIHIGQKKHGEDNLKRLLVAF